MSAATSHRKSPQESQSSFIGSLTAMPLRNLYPSIVLVTTSLLGYSIRSEFLPLFVSRSANTALSRKGEWMIVIILSAVFRQLFRFGHVGLGSRRKAEGV